MSISSLGGIWGMGPQSAKGAAPAVYYRYRALRVAGGAVTLSEPMPPEVSGQPIVDGAHKLGAYYAGVADMIPRLEADFGWLLYALAGDVSTVSNTPESNLFTHVFMMDPDDYLALKWLSVRRIIPKKEGGSNNPGESALDVRVASVMFTVAAAARLTTRVTTFGRVPSFSDNTTSWDSDWATEPEDSTSVAVASNDNSHFKIAGTPEPTQLVRVTIGNQVSQPRQEFIVGSPFPDDIVPLYRSVVADAVYKWEDPDIYHKVVANGDTGVEINWSPIVYESEFSVKISSPQNIATFATPYSLEIRVPRMYWFPSGPPEIAGLNILQLPLQGIAARPVGGGHPFEIHLINDKDGYLW